MKFNVMICVTEEQVGFFVSNAITKFGGVVLGMDPVFESESLKALPAPSKEVRGPRKNRSARLVLLDFAKASDDHKFTSKEAADVVVKHGLKKTSASNPIQQMLGKKIIKRIGPGQYQLVMKATANG